MTTYRDVIRIGSTNYKITNTELGRGVDGTIFKVHRSRPSASEKDKIVVKEMNTSGMSEKELEELVQIQETAFHLGFGPRLYDIFQHGTTLYIFMEQLEKTLTEYIREMKTNVVSIEEQIARIVRPIHGMMREAHITLGDDNTDNYMRTKNGEWVRIDFTTSRWKEKMTVRDVKQFHEFIYVHPMKHKIMKIHL
jgi:serine/threonine protein kinase